MAGPEQKEKRESKAPVILRDGNSAGKDKRRVLATG
jgi:hypothetical protein